MEDGSTQFDENAGKAMCAHCFDTIIAELDGDKGPEYPSDKAPDEKYPLFVTWTTGQEEDLRGCIGTFSPSLLSSILGRYSKISAFEDSRFNPIAKKEVSGLNVGLSLLINFTKIEDPLSWEVGKHGIEIDFTHKGRAFGATYLPEVASEQEWTQRETMESLIQKAGYYGSLDDVLDKIECTTYESLKFKMTFKEYEEYKATL
ncbi:unnamed protein product [Moneuplotes crassus]|uniref:AMMECR1 domain-containing protein n=1 Tax=Euplotes crassus TaxID=5936 RepID=A0AAD1XZ66_EUPCR|nr:unnamed protein product [Moneuplotes crassus]